MNDYISLQEYLTHTNINPPETALLQDDSPKNGPAAVRRPIKDKIIKMMHMAFNSFTRKRRETMEQVLHAHQLDKHIFWEVYTGSATLSEVVIPENRMFIN